MIAAIADSKSIASVIKKLNLHLSGGNYKTVHCFIKENNINIDHFTGKGWASKEFMSGLAQFNTIPMDKILNNEVSYKSSYRLKKRLIQEGYFEPRCYKCNGAEWMGEPMPLELEHINGNPFDNRLSNLTLLCPNCHALTPTHAGKNTGKRT